MKKLIFAFVVFAAVTVSVFAKGDKFFVHNETELLDFYELYISSPESDDWGDDVLDGKVIHSGKTRELYTENTILSMRLPDGNIDILLVGEDGDIYTIYNKKLTKNGTIRIDEFDIE
jgi:hypothetical protein